MRLLNETRHVDVVQVVRRKLQEYPLGLQGAGNPYKSKRRTLSTDRVARWSYIFDNSLLLSPVSSVIYSPQFLPSGKNTTTSSMAFVRILSPAALATVGPESPVGLRDGGSYLATDSSRRQPPGRRRRRTYSRG